jgi:hypothetical protein
VGFIAEGQKRGRSLLPSNPFPVIGTYSGHIPMNSAIDFDQNPTPVAINRRRPLSTNRRIPPAAK